MASNDPQQDAVYLVVIEMVSGRRYQMITRRKELAEMLIDDVRGLVSGPDADDFVTVTITDRRRRGAANPSLRLRRTAIESAWLLPQADESMMTGTLNLDGLST
ncbi:MAG: hypothetical protein QOJ19_3368 [Acidimicrobiia bacterium]|jgi:hypothetical protein|nr:hypothetical protein [Acidimicrobiia bacterium]